MLGQVGDVTKMRTPRSRTAGNIAVAAKSVKGNPGFFIPSLHRILHDDLSVKAYKV